MTTDNEIQPIEHIEETAHPCPCGKYSALDCMGECGFNDLKPPSKSESIADLFMAPVAGLPELSWQQSPSNPFVRAVCPEMLTELGWQVIDRNSPRNSPIPIHERPKAIFIYDRSYVVATLERVYSRLQCDALQFIELACDACELPDDSAIRHAACDDSVIIDQPIVFADYISLGIKANEYLTVLRAVQDVLREFRAMLPLANDKGEYPVRYTHAVKLLERLENLLKFETSLNLEAVDHEAMKAKVKRL